MQKSWSEAEAACDVVSHPNTIKTVTAVSRRRGAALKPRCSLDMAQKHRFKMSRLRYDTQILLGELPSAGTQLELWDTEGCTSQNHLFNGFKTILLLFKDIHLSFHVLLTLRIKMNGVIEYAFGPLNTSLSVVSKVQCNVDVRFRFIYLNEILRVSHASGFLPVGFALCTFLNDQNGFGAHL